jgi:hypothetical protein
MTNFGIDSLYWADQNHQIVWVLTMQMDTVELIVVLKIPPKHINVFYKNFLEELPFFHVYIVKLACETIENCSKFQFSVNDCSLVLHLSLKFTQNVNSYIVSVFYNKSFS